MPNVFCVSARKPRAGSLQSPCPGGSVLGAWTWGTCPDGRGSCDSPGAQLVRGRPRSEPCCPFSTLRKFPPPPSLKITGHEELGHYQRCPRTHFYKMKTNKLMKVVCCPVLPLFIIDQWGGGGETNKPDLPCLNMSVWGVLFHLFKSFKTIL